MLNTPQELSSNPLHDAEELEESPEALDEEQSSEEAEEPETEENDDEVYLIGDREITLAELKRLEDKGKNLESGYTKKRQTEAAEHKAKMQEAETLANALKAQADTYEAFLEEDESSVEWDDLTPSETRATEKKFRDRRKTLADMRKNAETAGGSVNNEVIAKTNEAVISHFSDEWQGKDSVRQKDLDNAMKYATSIGHTQETIAKLRTPQEFIALIDGGRLMGIKNAKPQTKKAIKAPKSTGKTRSKSGSSKSVEELFYGS